MADNRDYWSSIEEQGNVQISEDVVASIAAISASETEGVSGLSSNLGADIAGFLGKKNLSKGVRVKFDGDNVEIQAMIYVEYEYNVRNVAEEVQKSVKAAVESMTGLLVNQVNVYVCGVMFENKKTIDKEK